VPGVLIEVRRRYTAEEEVALMEAVHAALPSNRVLSFFEAALFSLVTHLPFRKLLDVSGHASLQRFLRKVRGARGRARHRIPLRQAPGVTPTL
jgi:hypothetical protein